MKTFILITSLLSAVSTWGFAKPNELSMAALSFMDSSVGKTPTYTIEAPEDRLFNGMGLGKSPTPMIVDGPPPQKSGPGLRFNTKQWFYIYTDRGAPPNHYAPSGWMGDYDDIRLDMDSRISPADGKTCIKIDYDASGHEGAGWAGMYWQHPVNNWGDKVGGYDLKGMKQLTFWARGEQGGEVIAEFKVGGIQGNRPDSDAVQMGPVVLSSDWKKYSLDLSGTDLSRISGGFAWSASQDDNPHGMTFFLDEIRFER